MRSVTRKWVGLVVITVAALAALGAYAIQARRATSPVPGAVAVLELYTSEGCSSCPPADDLLARILKAAREEHRAIYPLEFHVDSWNQATWSDPYSDAKYTRREEAYNKLGISDGVYTPQMIINGNKVAIGSDEQAVHSQTDVAMRTPAILDLKLTVGREKDQVNVTADVSAVRPGSLLNVALVERGIVSHVPKGENEGRVLHHENVVRAFDTAEITQVHTVMKLVMPHDAVASNCSIIAYVQDERLTVLGATEAPLPIGAKP
jgi:hypothetical protein